MKDSLLWYQSDCRQKCNAPHGSRRQSDARHGEIKVPRFKTKLQQFLSIDDQHWQDAINLQFKIDELISKLKTIKQQLSLQITDKKLLYALNWDNSDRIIDIFKLAINGEYNKMTCNDLFRVHQKIQKPRNVLIKEIKKISQDISDKLQKQVETAIKNCFNTGSRYDKREEVNVKQERTSGRTERVKENVRNPFDNNLPTVKINEIDQIQTHFNVLIKVIKINKHFRIEGMAKIECQAGDETGKSLVVIDQTNILKPGKVFAISNARIYSFHGVKQIQMSRKDSEISESKIDIDNIGEEYHLSRRRNRGKEQGKDRPPRRQDRQQHRRRGDDRQRENIQQRPIREERIVRDERPPIQDRRQRVNRPPREERPTRQYGRVEQEDNSERANRPERQRQRIQHPRNRQQRIDRDNRPPRPERPRRDRVSDYSQDKSQSIKTTQNNSRRPREYQIVKQQNRRANNEQDSRPRRQQYSKYERIPQKGKQQTTQKRKPSLSSSSSSSSEQSEKLQKKPSNQPTLQKIHSSQKFNKIGEIQPGDQGLNIIAQIFKKQIDGPQPNRGHFLSMIGDETGIVRINLPKNNPAVKQGAVIMITLANSEVDLDHRITLKLSDEGLIQKTNMKMTRININKNISEELWQSEEQDKEQQDQQPVIQDF